MDQATDHKGKEKRKGGLDGCQNPIKTRYLGPWNTPRSKRGMERNKRRWERAKNLVKTKVPDPKKCDAVLNGPKGGPNPVKT